MIFVFVLAGRKEFYIFFQQILTFLVVQNGVVIYQNSSFIYDDFF